MKYHPDKNPNDSAAEEKFKEASSAAEVLLNDEMRQRYDQFGHAGVNNNGGGFGGGGGFQDFGDLGDIFGDIFGDFMGGSRSGRGHHVGERGDDLQIVLDLDFEEAVFGIEKRIQLNKKIQCEPCRGSGSKDGSRSTCGACQGRGEIRRQQGFFTVASTCGTCRGSGQAISSPCLSCRGSGRKRKKVDIEVKIPAGIDEGQRLKLSGEGDNGTMGAPSGNLYVQVRVKPHKFFQREGADIFCKVPISFSQAALGAEVQVPSLSGTLMVKIPEGTQSGKKMRLRDRGIEKLGGYGKGDLILTIHVETPVKLTDKQREFFVNLAQEEKISVQSNPMSRGFFDKVKEFFHQ